MTWRKICAWHKSAKRQRLPGTQHLQKWFNRRSYPMHPLGETKVPLRLCTCTFTLGTFPRCLPSASRVQVPPAHDALEKPAMLSWRKSQGTRWEKHRKTMPCSLQASESSDIRELFIQLYVAFSNFHCMTKPTIPTWRGMTKRPSSTARSQLWKSMKIQHAIRKS